MSLDKAIRCFYDNVQRLEVEHSGPPPASDLQASLDWNLNQGLENLAVALRDLYQALEHRPARPEL